MKKRLLSTLLALCLALALLPNHALAAVEIPKETEYWKNLDFTGCTALAKGIRDKTEKENVVLVVYNNSNCPQSDQLIPLLPAFAEKNGITIYGFAAVTIPYEVIQLFPDENPGATAYVITYNASTETYIAQDTVSTTSAVEKQLQDNGLTTGAAEPEKPALLNDATMSVQDWQVLRQTNQYRMGKNLQPLSVFDALQKTANQRAYELITLYEHKRPDGTDYQTAYTDYQISYSVLAENIAKGQPTSTTVMDSWLKSDGQRTNIENGDLTHLGVGYRGASTDHTHYWSQNFLGSSGCRFTNLQLSKSTITGQPGTDLETLLTVENITVTANCVQHNTCRLPLIAAMCSGYDIDEIAPQTLTVTYGGQTTFLEVTGTGSSHTHEWGIGAVTASASCTADGIRTYICTGCGETKTEKIPAAGHKFAENSDGNFSCENGCGTLITKSLKEAYSEALTLNNKIYPYATSQEKSVLKEYVEEQAADILQALGKFSCTAEALSCTLPQNGNDGEYVYRLYIRNNTRTVVDEVVTEPLTMILPADSSGSEPFDTPGSSIRNPSSMPFTDIHSTAWYYPPVEYVWRHSLMSGISDTHFAPAATTSRAMIWTVLARMHDIHTDGDSGSVWYERGMLWAMQQGISDGSSPMMEVTREQLAAMFWRSAGSPHTTGDLTHFTDHAMVSTYAVDAMRWAVSSNIIQGTNGRLNPQSTATRAEVAAMVMRYAENIA